MLPPPPLFTGWRRDPGQTSLVNNLEHEDPLELREILTKKEDPELESCASSIFEDEADFEWI